MEAAVEEKFDYLESVLGHFIVSTNTSLSRLEKNVSALSNEMRDFKNEMRDFKDEMHEFKDEMLVFNNEMREFKNEMREFKDESQAERKSMNKKWRDLANKLGTVVEDIVSPSLGGIARQYFNIDEFEFFAVRLKKRKPGRQETREFDVVAAGEDYFFVVETKASPRTKYIHQFIDFIPHLKEWFPDTGKRAIIPIFASLYLPREAVNYLTNNHIFALAMKDDNMDILNEQVLEHYR